ncbi:MAG: hypothetical protein V4485_01495 [Pseudomonadota bacterium]
MNLFISCIILLTCIFYDIPHVEAVEITEQVRMEGEDHVDFTITGKATIKNSNITGTLTVAGPLFIEHSHVGNGAIIGGVEAYGLDAYSLHVTGSISIGEQTKVEALSVMGPLFIKNSKIGSLNIAGTIQSDDSKIISIEATSNEMSFWNTRLGKVAVSSYSEDKKPIIIKFFGNTQIEELSIYSTANPMAIIVLDDSTALTFNKAQVNCTGAVEYKTYKP